ncbi:MAG: uncharacterized protein QOH66_1546 [Actinomycetota bacterium]|jgi:phage tail sheath protein FI|nr:uncharacterized protein [Actinomycetota bacterium]
MPEYLAPGVYVEEVSFRNKSIEGVSTTTTGFVGPTRYGPVAQESDVLTSLLDFERVFGDRHQLAFVQPAGPPSTVHNYMWHAARAFFENGGARLYVRRIYHAPAGSDGRASASILPTGSPPGPPRGLTVKARFPGEAGGRGVRLTVQVGQNVLTSTGGTPPSLRLNSVVDRDVVLIVPPPPLSPPGPAAAAGGFYLARSWVSGGVVQWQFEGPLGSPGLPIRLDALGPQYEVHQITLSVTDIPPAADAISVVWSGLPLDPGHQLAGARDSLFDRFSESPANRADALNIPLVIERTGIATGLDVLQVLFDHASSLQAATRDPTKTDADRSINLQLSGGSDGLRPTATDYEGATDPVDNSKTGLVAFEDIEDISIVAAPGATLDYEASPSLQQQGLTIANLLISHCERMRYRIAVLDSGNAQTLTQVRAMRAQIDSKYAAFYYPWVLILDPVTQEEIPLPPSGFVSGIYARNDIQRAVYKAPANEVVTLAIGFEKTLNKGQQDILNPEGINGFRFFSGRGYRLWGARTATSDPEWKYVNLRRYFAYLEHSIDRGTQWAVFEPNGELLWSNVQRTIQNFLLNEWKMGALLGSRPEEAYFVKCDRSTMTQNDLDNGRLVCLIGVAPLRPAEYVIFRIGQWTADAKQ